MDPPTVSVITACYKQAQYLTECIDSVLGQDESAEMIVVDDGSPDDTQVVAKRFGGKITYVRQENAGQAIARNNGFGLSAGQYLIFLDADDALLPGALRFFREAAMGSPDAVAFIGGRRDVNVDGKFIRRHPPPQIVGDPLHALLLHNIAPPACFMISRQAFLEAGLFSADRRLLGHEDWDLWLRIATEGGPFVTVPNDVAAYRVSGNSVSSNLPRMFASAVCALHNARGYHQNCAGCRKAIHMGLVNQRRVFANMGFGGGLDMSRSLGDVKSVLTHAAGVTMVDPGILPYIVKAVLLRPWRRHKALKMRDEALGRV